MFGFEAFMIQGAFKLVLAVTGIVVSRITLYYIHKLVHESGTPFAEWLANADDRSRGIYYAGQYIAIAIIVGSAVS